MADPQLEKYFEKPGPWQSSLKALRKLVLKTELKEERKWGMPTYTYDGKPIVGISGFKNHFGLWFFHGALLTDPHNNLINAQEGKTQAMRQLRFTADDQLDTKMVLSYIQEAVKNAKNGYYVQIKKKPLIIPDLLKKQFKEDTLLKEAFAKLNLSKQRDFAEYIASAKRESTQLSRLEKITPMIKKGIGLNDKYKN